MTAWFDDTNIHFLCDSDGNAIAGQSYSTTGRLYVGPNAVALDTQNSKAENDDLNFSLLFGGVNNTEAVLTVTGFKNTAKDNNIIVVTLVSADGSETRVSNIHVDKVRPGADGKSPVVYNVVPSVNILKKSNDGTFAPTTVGASVRKSYVEDDVVKNAVLTPQQAQTQEGITIYYGYDKVVKTIAAATGTLANGELTPPSTLESFIHFVIAKSDGVILDSQSVGVLMDGESVIMIDLDNENDSMLYEDHGYL